jgi:hypothetical protein
MLYEASSKRGRIVKRFARCTNCQQWYIQTSTASVEIYQHDRLCCITVWCLRCIDEAERRSQLHSPSAVTDGSTPTLHTADTEECFNPVPSSDPFQQFMQEHLQLMDRALHDDEALLIPAIQDFMERCRLYQIQLDIPDQYQRLARHLQYWETFLKALNA